MITQKRRLLTLGIFGCFILTSVEVSIVSTAAPKIVESLGGLNHFSWIFTAYLLASSIFMPAWGRIADHYGRKPVVLCALVLFLLGSLLCGISQSLWQLLLSRFVQGMGAGALVPIGFTLLSDLYSYRERARVQAYASSIWGISSLIGPFLGGILTHTVHWRFIFLINLIPGIPTLWLFAKLLPVVKSTGPFRLSPKSFVVSVATLFALVVTIMLVQEHEYQMALWLGLVTVLLATLFVYYEKNEKYPFVHPEIFSHKIILAGCLTGFMLSGMLIGISSFAPLLFQTIHHYSLTESGLLIFPLSLSWVIGSFFSIRLALKIPYKTVVMAGTILTLVGYMLFLNQFGQLTTVSTVTFFVMVGAGMAFNYPVVLITMQHSIPKHLVSFATSALVWTRNLGATVITAVMGVVLTTTFENHLKQASTRIADHPFLNLYQNEPGLLLHPGTMAQVHTDPVINQSFESALFAAFFVMLVAAVMALLMTRLFPDKVTLREV